MEIAKEALDRLDERYVKISDFTHLLMQGQAHMELTSSTLTLVV